MRTLLYHDGLVTNYATIGRVNQKERTRAAIIEAARELSGSGTEITMSVVAAAARVSEATAYRYFPDLGSLLLEAVASTWPSVQDALAPVADSRDPIQRVAFATDFLLREVLNHQGTVRLVMSAAITKRGNAALRPARRFGLIDHALAPWTDTLADSGASAAAQLRRDLAVVVSAEAFFTLTDLCQLAPEEAITSAVATATTLTRAAVQAVATADGTEKAHERHAISQDIGMVPPNPRAGSGFFVVRGD